MNQGGDVLARGFRSANFPASSGKVSQKKWDEIFGDYTPESSKEDKIETKPLNIPTAPKEK